MKIKLTRGYEAIIDDEDYYKVSQYTWRAVIVRNRVVAQSHRRNAEGKRVGLLMHRLILDLVSTRTPIIDHKNRNSLDNRKENLRICNHSQNHMNVGKPRLKRKPTSKYKGVHFSKNRKGFKKWKAVISINFKRKSIGWFKTEKEAAKAYDLYAKQHFGDFAILNFRKR